MNPFSSVPLLQSRRPRVAALLALLFTVLLGSIASAVTIGNVDGVWGSPTPAATSSFRWCYGANDPAGAAGAPTSCSSTNSGIQNSPSTTQDENQFRYGTPASGSGNANRSGYGFNGNDNVGTITGGTPFYLGRFTHYNLPITADNPLTGISLDVTVTNLLCDDGVAPTEGSTLTLTYGFTHEETNNSASSHPGGVCPYGNTGGNGCDDRVTVTSQPNQTFHCSNGEYTVEILGFYTGANCHTTFPGGAASNRFITAENATNSACLWAKIATPLAVQMNYFGAEWANDKVVVQWETASELDNLGFNIYRSLAPDQLGEKINSTMIPTQGSGTGMGYSYTFDDTTAAAGQTYWYTLEALDIYGASSMHGPVSVVPQTPTAVTVGSMSGTSSNRLPWLIGGLITLIAVGAAGWRRRSV